MAGPDPSDAAGEKRSLSNLTLRVLAALVLAPLAIGIAYLGGVYWLALALLAAIGLYSEWLNVTGTLHARITLIAGLIVLLAMAVLLYLSRAEWALGLLCVGVLLIALLAPSDKRLWCASGMAYAGLPLIACVLIRGAGQDGATGLAALMFVFVVVWASDIFGYFVGRAIGGPKLWERVSPKKTWAGAIGGLAGSVAGGMAFGFLGYQALALGALAGVLAIVSQAGDLVESAVKRRFGVKDSSHIIPGHGGVMDRLDGFVFAVTLAAMIGVARAGFAHVPQGAMWW